MLEELQRRNFSEHTIRYYIRTVEDFARHFNRPPDRLGPRHIREYQAELFQKRKLSPGTVAIRLAALRFFYIKTLKKSWSIAETPYPKKTRRLPTILSQKERSEEHTSELQSRLHLVCRLLLEKKKTACLVRGRSCRSATPSTSLSSSSTSRSGASGSPWSRAQSKRSTQPQQKNGATGSRCSRS